MNILAIDPGTAKCGVAVLDSKGKVLFREITATSALPQRLTALLGQWNITHAIYGQSTNADAIRQMLEGLKSTFMIHGVDERNSTLEARPLYWQENPRHGLLRLLPLSLLAPPEAIDDFAAIVLGRRFLENKP